MTTVAVDVHAHLMPDAAFGRVPPGLSAVVDEDAVALHVQARGKRGRGAPRMLRDLDTHRAQQVARGVDVSLTGPWVDMVKAPLDAALQHRWCTVLNEELARATAGGSHTRFLAALCDLDGGRAAECLESAVRAGAVGGMLATHTDGGGTLARPGLDTLWGTAERLGVPIVLHPGEFEPPRGCANTSW